MNTGILEQLRRWRADRAEAEGTELFRVFPNETLEAIARVLPETEADLLTIKGVGDKKLKKYGTDILAIVGGESISSYAGQGSLLGEALSGSTEEDHVFSVGTYLEFLNVGLRKSEARVRGEISSVDIRKGYLFFSIKDNKDEALLSCFMWENGYNAQGVELKEGLEVVVHGFPEVYKRTGRMSFRVDAIELVGEGALKKAYDELKAKLEKEGVFAPERKRAIPELPRKIGVITSRSGAVLNDFLNNLGRFGFKIFFKDSRVEGQQAVTELLRSMKTLKKANLDVLVLIRGGGSLESLLPFNNEALVRAVTEFPVPVICGIGHDKDAPLVSLAADLAVSAPTAAAMKLNDSWEKAGSHMQVLERDILTAYREALVGERHRLERLSTRMRTGLTTVFDKFRAVEGNFREQFYQIGYEIKRAGERITSAARALTANDPERQLQLGYSIVSKGNKVVRKVGDVSSGDDVAIRVSDGIIESEVIKTKRDNG